MRRQWQLLFESELTQIVAECSETSAESSPSAFRTQNEQKQSVVVLRWKVLGQEAQSMERQQIFSHRGAAFEVGQQYQKNRVSEVSGTGRSPNCPVSKLSKQLVATE